MSETIYGTKHSKSCIQNATDIIVSHSLTATLSEVVAAYEAYLAQANLNLEPEAEVRYMFGDTDYGTTKTLFTHNNRAE